VNQGGASGIEIARLANEVRKSVFMKFGIWIEPEVYVI
jgi:UDP-N-acetylenolpyruvoylglucosamine reductase, C-terminal domain